MTSSHSDFDIRKKDSAFSQEKLAEHIHDVFSKISSKTDVMEINIDQPTFAVRPNVAQGKVTVAFSYTVNKIFDPKDAKCRSHIFRAYQKARELLDSILGADNEGFSGRLSALNHGSLATYHLSIEKFNQLVREMIQAKQEKKADEKATGVAAGIAETAKASSKADEEKSENTEVTATSGLEIAGAGSLSLGDGESQAMPSQDMLEKNVSMTRGFR